MKRAFEKVCSLTPVEKQLLAERSPEEMEGLIELGEWYWFFHVDNRQLKKDFKKIKEMVDQMDKL